ncbi:MAG: helix-turn-helix transcriptional regulator [Chloroflexi bacterium]|nr:helix-turn-helix transcriptional regulator [Chloroflexota bacterium]
METLVTLPNGEKANIVFKELCQHKAMPLLEIASATGIRGKELRHTIKELADNNFVTIKGGDDPATTIVSVSGKNY